MVTVGTKYKKILLLAVAIILSLTTYILPIFFALPKWIYLNIAGSFLVAYGLGPVPGMFYAGILSFGISNFGIGSGLNGLILVIQIIESGLIGILKVKKSSKLVDIATASVLLALLYKPLSQIVYIFLNSDIEILELSINNIYIEYIKNGFLSNLIIYLFSGLIAYVILNVIEKMLGEE